MTLTPPKGSYAEPSSIQTLQRDIQMHRVAQTLLRTTSELDNNMQLWLLDAWRSPEIPQ